MQTRPCPPCQWGLTGPHPNPLSDLLLRRPSGATVSLHRYAGRWLIARVSDVDPGEAPPSGDLLPEDFVPVFVVSGPIPPGAARDDGGVVYDTARAFATRFPAIDLPATYVIDPEGRLVAILDDHGWPGFLEGLIRETGKAPAHGAIDRRDLSD
jgi:hypothetical protein